MQNDAGMYDAAPLRTLPPSTSFEVIALACREAALAFLNGTSEAPWGKRELAAWLLGPYETAVHLTAGLTRYSVVRRAAERPVLLRTVQRVILDAHEDALRLLSTLGEVTGGGEVVWSASHEGLVVGCRDATGVAGWVPVVSRAMGLSERVRSLLAADFLMRSDDYAELLAVCPRCGLVQFDASARSSGACAREPATGVFPKISVADVVRAKRA
jgi:hypothetical protein